MRVRVLFKLLSFLLLIAVPTLAQQQSARQNAAQPLQAPLNNKDVLEMQGDGLTADVIIAKIKSSPCNFDTSPTTLGELRRAKVPNEVILAMVEAPAGNSSTRTNDRQSADSKNTLEHPRRSYLGLRLADAAPPAHGVLVRNVAPAGPAAHAGIREGDLVEAVDGQPIANLRDYHERLSPLAPGTQVRLKILRGGQESEISATTVPPSPELVSVVKAIAYKSLPYYSKTVYQISPGSSSTTCDGTTYGNIECDTTYQPPQQGEINWRTIYNYNVVEGGGYRFVTLCTASVRWSKCVYLIPGESFAAEVKGGQMWITGYKNGNQNKPERVKYDILQVAPTQ